MGEPYRHTALLTDDTIRLLDLLPAWDRKAPVRCRIRQVRLDEAFSKYEALSYVWGDAQGSRPILCDGFELLVTPNCHDAMVELRRRHRSRTLWIDSICIDQTPESKTERNHQVKNMGYIYRNASTVLIWLGSEELDLTTKDHLLYLVSLLRAKIRYNSLAFLAGIALDSQDYIYSKDYIHKFYDYSCVFSVVVHLFGLVLTGLCRRDGSEVLSHAPETGKPPMVHTSMDCAGVCFRTKILDRLRCKKNTLVNLEFHERSFRSERRSMQSDSVSKRCTFTYNIRGATTPYPYDGDPFLHATHRMEERRLRFLRSIRDLDSKLQHDKIYGIYAILRAINIHLPDPDYSKPIQEVAREYTRAVVYATYNLDLITLDLPPTGILGTPSWVLDFWTQQLAQQKEFGKPILESVFCLSAQQPRASRTSKAHFPKETPASKLVARGKKVATLETTIAYHSKVDIPHAKRTQQPREFVQVCRDWCHACSGLPKHEIEIQHSLGADWLDHDNMPYWIDLMRYPACHIVKPQDYARFSKKEETDPVTIITNYLSLGRGQDDQMVDHLQDLFYTTAEWAFVLTDNGLTGRAYRTCQKDDQLWLLAGSSVPVVLRPAEVEGEYSYITPAYFYRLMDGAFWPEDGEEGLESINLV